MSASIPANRRTAHRAPTPVEKGDEFADFLLKCFELGGVHADLLLATPATRFGAREFEQIKRIDRVVRGHAGMKNALLGTFLVGASLSAFSLCHASLLVSHNTKRIITAHGIRGQQTLVNAMLQLPQWERRRVIEAVDDPAWKACCERVMALARVTHFLQDNDLQTFHTSSVEALNGADLIIPETPRFHGTVMQLHLHTDTCIVPVKSHDDVTAKILLATEKFNHFHGVQAQPVLVMVNIKHTELPLESIRDCVDLFSAVRSFRRYLMKPHV